MPTPVPTAPLSGATRDPRLPVTVLTGFLGAGKPRSSTAFSPASTAKKNAVIENEFGEVGVDNQPRS